MSHVIWTGICSNVSPSNTILTDILSYFDAMDIDSDIIIDNLTDGSSARYVSTIDSNNVLTEGLTGGHDNMFTDGDSYDLRISDQYQEGTLDLIYHLQQRLDFSTRVIDARLNARKRAYETQRRGIVAEYRNAWTPLDQKLDPYHGNAKLTEDPFTLETQGGLTTAFYRDAWPVRNLGVEYGPVQKIRLMYVNPTEQTSQTPWGLVSTGNVICGAPLIYPFRRMDLLKIHGKFWMINDVPAIEYWQNKEIIGMQLLCVPIQHQQIGF